MRVRSSLLVVTGLLLSAAFGQVLQSEPTSDLAQPEIEPAPEAEGPVPESEEPAPESEGPTPKSEGPAPESEGTAPESEGPAPEVEGPAPEAEGPAPEAEGPAPEAEGPNTNSDEEPSPSYAEPEPNWEEAKILWGSAWQVHIYLFGVAFGVVALYSLFSVIRLWKKKHLLSQKYFISLNLLVFLMGAVRSIYLLIDAYNTRRIFPSIVSYMLYTIFLPCVTSTFSLLFLSLLAATRMKFISPSIQKTRVILGVILFHFILAITTDILTVFHLDARVILFVCQVFYITWGLFLFVGFMYIFGRLYKAAKDRQTQMNKYALRKLAVAPASSVKHKPEQHKLTLSLGTIVTLISSILGLLTVMLLIYGMVDVYGVFVTDKVPEPWRWWVYHTAFRTLELAICVTVGYVATQPFRYHAPTKYNSLSSGGTSEETHRCSRCFFYCAPCWSWCAREQKYSDVEWSELHSEGEYTLRRKESDKSDLPLHDLVNCAQVDEVKKTAPQSPVQPESPQSPEPMLGQTTPALFKSEHCVLMFSSVDRLNYATDQVKTSLSIGREYGQGDFPLTSNTKESDNLLPTSVELGAVEGAKEELSSLTVCNIRWSEQSLDKVSQMSPELETSIEDEMSGLLVDV